MNEEKSTCSSARQIVEGEEKDSNGCGAGGAVKEDGRGKNRKVAWLKEIQPGMKIHLLTVQQAASPIFYNKGNRLVTVNRWECLCDCGNTTIVRHNCLKFNRPQSCGCVRDEKMKKTATKHGFCQTDNVRNRAYSIWVGMRERCRNPRNVSFSNYGGRGITVCDRWKEFINFISDMGNPPPDTSIDRINNDGNYEPDNCRWATRQEQGNNTRSNRLITLNGVTQNITQWAAAIGHTTHTITRRLKRGLSIEKSLSTTKNP